MTTSDEYEPADSPPAAEELEFIAALGKKQLRAIDSAIMLTAREQRRKVAFVVGAVMDKLHARVPGIPDVFLAQRVAALVSQGRLESRGDLSRMRYSEVRVHRQPVKSFKSKPRPGAA